MGSGSDASVHAHSGSGQWTSGYEPELASTRAWTHVLSSPRPTLPTSTNSSSLPCFSQSFLTWRSLRLRIHALATMRLAAITFHVAPLLHDAVTAGVDPSFHAQGFNLSGCSSGAFSSTRFVRLSGRGAHGRYAPPSFFHVNVRIYAHSCL